ncbi:MAG: PKD domain-containing protein [Proteobacteria bacterium]|nr:PKD domain-containing protein [Pseudomonadota bacterium]
MKASGERYGSWKSGLIIFAMLCVVSIGAGTGCNGSAKDQVSVPTASFAVLPTSPVVGSPAQFTDTSTGSPTSWAWNFGDGVTSAAQNPSHTYATPNPYMVSLTVRNDLGSDTVTRDITIQEQASGAASCVVEADCSLAGACPPDAVKGCTCSPTPKGDRCVPQCTTADDCPKPPDQTLTCSTDGLCVPDEGENTGGGGDGNSDAEMNTADTISDEAQSMTIAFDGLAFVTGSFCAQTFYPPGKVADFFGFQYLRDNDPSGMGHNTDFTTLTADPILVLLDDTQLKTLSDLGVAEASLNDNYGYARFPLAKAFRRLFDGDMPTGKTGLSQEAVKAYSAYLFSIDGEMSYLRAQAYASVLGSMDTAQQATLAAMKGKGSLEWTQPSQSEIDAVMAKYPGQMMRTYAGEMLAWYLGNIDADVYFCPERQGTYFGSFFMKDIKAMHNPSYTIDSNMTANMGDSFLTTLDSTTQRPKVTGLITTQKTDLANIVAKRTEISNVLRNFLAQGTVSETTVVGLAREYGELDGEISYYYATAFSSLGLTDAQKATLMALRKTATAEAGGNPDYDSMCGNGYLYSAPLATAPTVMDTDFMFGVCGAAASTCSTDWNCCSFSCQSHVCSIPFTFTSSVFVDAGTLPQSYTCDDTLGMNAVSPPLSWTGAPAGTVEFALMMTTIANDGTKYNWVLFHIPGTATSLGKGTTGVGTAGQSTDGPELRYYPPCSSGPGAKTYTFTLYALSGVPTFAVPESQVTGAILASAIGPLTISSRQLNVSYTRTGLY